MGVFSCRNFTLVQYSVTVRESVVGRIKCHDVPHLVFSSYVRGPMVMMCDGGGSAEDEEIEDLPTYCNFVALCAV